MKKLKFKDILSTKQFSRQDLDLIFNTSKEMEKYLSGEKTDKPLEGKIMASMFYEPSTRTRMSFEAAIYRLGGSVISVSDTTTTSLFKGETLEDNAQITEMYSDIIVMRHPEPYSVDKTAKACFKSVINAGDGKHQHPTQALLDVYTILKEKKTLDNLKIVIVGDLKYGRTAHSLVFLMSLYQGTEFTFISPDELKMPKKITDFLREKKIKYKENGNYKEGIKGKDVLYVTRIQKERFTDLSEYHRIKDDYILDLNVLDGNTNISIMHPLPRVNELKNEIDKLPNAAYFRQAKNGVPIRMALLYLLLK